MRLTLRITIVALVVMAWPSAAFAAGWQAPFAVGPARAPAGLVAVNDAGYATFVSGVRTQHGPTRRLMLRLVDPSNGVSARRVALPAGYKTVGGRPYVSAAGRVIVLGAAARATRSPRPQLLIASGTVTDLPSAAQVLSTDCARMRQCSAVDPVGLVWRPDGSAVVAWTELDRTGPGGQYARVRATVIGADGRAAETVTLADEPLHQGVQLGVTSAGTVIATWMTTRRSIVTRRLAPGLGDVWSPAQTESLPLQRAPGAWAEVLTDSAGNQHAIWSHGWRRPKIRAAYRPAGGRFQRPVTLAREDARDEVDFEFDADVGPDGTALVAWSLQGSTNEGEERSLRESTRPVRRGTRGSLRVRIAQPGARWSATQRVGARRRFPGFPSAAVAGDGTAILTWSEYGRWPGRSAKATQTLAATGATFSHPTAIPGTFNSRGVCANGELAVAPAGTAVLLLDCPGPSLARAIGPFG